MWGRPAVRRTAGPPRGELPVRSAQINEFPAFIRFDKGSSLSGGFNRPPGTLGPYPAPRPPGYSPAARVPPVRAPGRGTVTAHPAAGSDSAHPRRPCAPTDPPARRLRAHEFTRPRPGSPTDPCARRPRAHVPRNPDRGRPGPMSPESAPPGRPRLHPVHHLRSTGPCPSREGFAPRANRRNSRPVRASRLHGIPVRLEKIAHVIPAFPGFPDRRQFAVISAPRGSLIATMRSRAISYRLRSGTTFL
jgi:hypothetical protein